VAGLEYEALGEEPLGIGCRSRSVVGGDALDVQFRGPPDRKKRGRMKHIQLEERLGERAREPSAVVGISDLEATSLSREVVRASRGEFVGHFVEKDRLVLFRDRLGARNLYYGIRNGSVVVSTDLAWVAERIGAEPNWSYINSDYLQFQIPFGEETFFAGIRKVMPGEFVSVDADGNVEREKYWEIEFGDRPFRAEELAELIRDAVRFRLSFVEGRPYTAYLSGGLDSSTAVLLATPNECFSGFYEEEGYSEMDYIETVIEHVADSTKYTPVQITAEAFQGMLESLPDVLPDPCGGLGVVPQVLVAREAAERGYEYAFTGEGGDEVFLGYNWNTMVFAMVDAARSLLRDRYMVRYEPMVDKVLRDGLATFTGGLLARGEDILYATGRILDLWDRSQPVENNVLFINLKLGLPAILTLDEQVGRFAGVEPVSPLMDHRIVEYVCSIRPGDRAPIPKHMMREALKGVLPEKIRTRYEKMGFPVPYEEWKWPTIGPALRSLQRRGSVDFEPRRHTTMDRKTWALYSIEAWCKRYVDGMGSREGGER
jgi:asparagine synthase (glutamine-hydrolysing)